MSKGFTDQIQEAQDRSQVYETGRANLADRTFQGKAIANIGEALGGVVELGVDIFGNKMFDELTKARSDAFTEYEQARKKGEAGVKQGRTPIALYNATLLNKIKDIESRYPGFSEELEEAKRKMGIRPRADSIAEAQRLNQQNETILFQNMQKNGTIVFSEDGTIDREASIKLNAQVSNTNKLAAVYENRAKQVGLTAKPGEHTPLFIEGYKTLTDKISAQYMILNRDIFKMVNDVQSGKTNPKELMTTIPVLVSRHAANLKTSVNVVWKGADAEVLNKLIDDQSGMILQLITGSKDPKGLADNIKALNEFQKGVSVADFRDHFPAMAAILDQGGDEAFKIVMSEMITENLKGGNLREQGKRMTAYFNGLSKTGQPFESAVGNISLTPKDQRQNSQTAVGVMTKLLNTKKPNEETASFIHSNLAHIWREHTNNTLTHEDYSTLSKIYEGQNMKSMIQSLPDNRRRREVGALGFEILNGSALKRFEQLDENFSQGLQLKTNANGDIDVVLTEGTIQAIEARAGRDSVAPILAKHNKKLNTYINNLAYYSAYKDVSGDIDQKMGDDLPNASTQDFIKNKFLMHKKLITESFKQRYPAKGASVPNHLKNSSKAVVQDVAQLALAVEQDVIKNEVPLPTAIIKAINDADYIEKINRAVNVSDETLMNVNLDDDAVAFHNEMVSPGKVELTGVTVYDLQEGETRHLTVKQYQRAKQLQGKVQLTTLPTATSQSMGGDIDPATDIPTATSQSMGGDIDQGRKPWAESSWIEKIEYKDGREGLIKFFESVDRTKLGQPGSLTHREMIELTNYLGEDVPEPVGFEIPTSDDASGVGPGRPRSLRPEDQGISFDYTSPTFGIIKSKEGIAVEALPSVSSESEEIISTVVNRLNIPLPYTNIEQGVRFISQAIQAVETGGEANPQTATNPKSTAAGYYQIISGTRQSAAQRMINILGEDKVPAWVNEAVQPMNKEEHQTFMGSLSKENQETLFLVNLFESKGSDAIFKRIVDSNFQDDNAIADLYMEIHHTEPSAKLKRRFIKSLNEVKGLLMEEEMK